MTGDPASMFEWSVKVHNIVNSRLHKPLVTVEKALESWTKKDDNQFYFKIQIAFIVLMLAFLFFMLTKK